VGQAAPSAGKDSRQLPDKATGAQGMARLEDRTTRRWADQEHHARIPQRGNDEEDRGRPRRRQDEALRPRPSGKGDGPTSEGGRTHPRHDSLGETHLDGDSGARGGKMEPRTRQQQRIGDEVEASAGYEEMEDGRHEDGEFAGEGDSNVQGAPQGAPNEVRATADAREPEGIDEPEEGEVPCEPVKEVADAKDGPMDVADEPQAEEEDDLDALLCRSPSPFGDELY